MRSTLSPKRARRAPPAPARPEPGSLRPAARREAAEADPGAAPAEPAPPGLAERVTLLEEQVAELQRRLDER